MVQNAGPHPFAFRQAHDGETAVTLSVARLFQTKALLLGDAIDAPFLWVGHGIAPIEPEGLYDRCRAVGRFSRPVAGLRVVSNLILPSKEADGPFFFSRRHSHQQTWLSRLDTPTDTPPPSKNRDVKSLSGPAAEQVRTGHRSQDSEGCSAVLGLAVPEILSAAADEATDKNHPIYREAGAARCYIDRPAIGGFDGRM
jgi:hypothetical protein